MMYKYISSLHNPSIKRLFQLQEKSRSRKKEAVFLVEGLREMQLALKGSFELLELYFCDEMFMAENIPELIGQSSCSPDIIEISIEVYRKIAYRGSTEGIIAVFRSKITALSELNFSTKNPLVLVAEAPEKPGNIGALLRTADAANLDAVIIANPKTDLFNPNIIRSSVGCVFTNQITTGTTQEIISFLKHQNITIYSAAIQASKNYTEVDFNNATAIVVGTEDTGLSDEWLKNSTQNINIPMAGEIDSINLSVAAGILIFEAKRQRGFS